MTRLASDDNDNTIQALKPNTAQKFSTSSASARSAAMTSGVKIVQISCTKACYFKLGDSTVAATTSDHYLPADTLLAISIGTATHIAAIRSSEDGTFHISELV